MGNVNHIHKFIDIGIKISVLGWVPPEDKPKEKDFLLLHGLASNAITWSFVAHRLAEKGHHVYAIDQRGHGESDKPENGYDYETITGDLFKVIEYLELKRPVLAGQSWGGNVLLEFAARNPGLAMAYVFVDGGFLELHGRGTWGQVSQMLKPPKLNGLERQALRQRIQANHPTWSEEVVGATMGNFESIPGGKVKPNLSLEHHMAILRAMYDQETQSLYQHVKEPVLICVADDGSQWAEMKRSQLEIAQAGIANSEVIWFKGAAHDIHQDRPDELSAAILKFMANI